MRSYRTDSTFAFGMHKWKTIADVFKSDPTYLEWCVINIPHFYLPPNTIERLKSINPNFTFSNKVIEILKQIDISPEDSGWAYVVYNEPNEEDDDDNYNNDDDDYRPSYNDWLRTEFGDDAREAYWNMD